MVREILRIEDLKAGDVVTIEFAVAERTEHWKCGPEYSLRFKGNTLVQIDPPLETGPLETAPPIGNRRWLYELRPERYRSTKAPLKKLTRFVSPLALKW